MKLTERSRRIAEWAVWFLHAPLGFLWLATAILTIAAIVTLATNPRHAAHVFELAATMAGLVKLFAHVKGIPAWPLPRSTRRADAERARE